MKGKDGVMVVNVNVFEKWEASSCIVEQLEG